MSFLFRVIAKTPLFKSHDQYEKLSCCSNLAQPNLSYHSVYGEKHLLRNIEIMTNHDGGENSRF